MIPADRGVLEVIKGAYDAFLGKEIDYNAFAPKWEEQE